MGTVTSDRAAGSGGAWLIEATELLEAAGVAEARLNAEYLLAEVLGCRRLEVLLRLADPLSPEHSARLSTLLQRRARREPLEYILGYQDFRGLRLEVSPAVLIPRPETEYLVELVLRWLRSRQLATPRILDVGTGSGCIALALAAEHPTPSITAVDLSEDALAIARHNAEKTGLAGRVIWQRSDLLAGLEPGTRWEVLVSNPPYVAPAEAASLAPEVRDYEPHLALFASGDGLDLIRQLVTQATQALAGGGLLAVEIGANQGAACLALVADRELWSEAAILPDLTGRDRYLWAVRSE